VEAHNDKIRALRMRQEELTAAIEDQQTAPIPRRKAVLHRLIAEIRIEGPEAIYPTVELPMEHLRDQTVRHLRATAETDHLAADQREGLRASGALGTSGH
jgi:hypothetical protein